MYPCLSSVYLCIYAFVVTIFMLTEIVASTATPSGPEPCNVYLERFPTLSLSSVNAWLLLPLTMFHSTCVRTGTQHTTVGVKHIEDNHTI